MMSGEPVSRRKSIEYGWRAVTYHSWAAVVPNILRQQPLTVVNSPANSRPILFYSSVRVYVPLALSLSRIAGAEDESGVWASRTEPSSNERYPSSVPGINYRLHTPHPTPHSYVLPFEINCAAFFTRPRKSKVYALPICLCVCAYTLLYTVRALPVRCTWQACNSILRFADGRQGPAALGH